ncbi:hypothetical protein CSC35_4157 [Enterobacter hormaechei]|nr:hypothetical protein CSC35_4157 [Enterobacter hormaechei]
MASVSVAGANLIMLFINSFPFVKNAMTNINDSHSHYNKVTAISIKSS